MSSHRYPKRLFCLPTYKSHAFDFEHLLRLHKICYLERKLNKIQNETDTFIDEKEKLKMTKVYFNIKLSS